MLVNNKVDKDIQIRLDIFRSQVYIASHVMDGLEGIYKFLGLRYTFRSKAHIAHYILSELEDTCNPLGPRYMLHLIFLVD